MTLTTGWSVPAAGEAPMAMARAASHLRLLRLQPQTPRRSAGLTDSAGHRLRFTQTPRLHARHPAAQRWRAVPRRAALSGAPKTRNDRPMRGHPRRHRRSGIPQTVRPAVFNQTPVARPSNLA